jgi:uncharacterized membrane protein HdeD (DUF308 family)
VRLTATLLALAYAALGVLSALYLTLIGMLGCYESCTNTGGWTDQADAWQWDLLLALGLVTFGLALVAVFVVVGRPRWGLVAIGAHAAVLAVAAGFAAADPHLRIDEVVFWYTLTIGSGLGLFYARRRLSASSTGGAPDTRAGRSA